MPEYKDKMVSIITPAYNSARFITDTINSVLTQTYPHWELLVVDDCSTDETRDIVRQFSASEPRIRLVLNSENSGPAITRDNAIKIAEGRYIAFLDSDDSWLPEKLEQQLSYMEREKVAFTYTRFRRISEKGETLGNVIHIPRSLNYFDLLKNTAIATSTVILDRKMTGDISMTNAYYDDFVLWLELTKKGIIAYGLNQDLMRYRVVGGSVSRNKSRSAYHVWKTYREIEKLGLIRSSWSFINYAWHGFKKYKTF